MINKMLKKIGNEVYIDIPNFNHLKIPFIILISISSFIDVVLVFKAYKTGIEIPSDYYLLFLFTFFLIVIYVFLFGFTKNYFFDLNKKRVIIKGSKFFSPYRKEFCGFDEIAILGIKCIRFYNSKKRTYFYNYSLVFAVKTKPKDYIKLISLVNTNSNSSSELKKLNELGYSLSDLIKCKFLEGQKEMSIAYFDNDYINNEAEVN